MHYKFPEATTLRFVSVKANKVGQISRFRRFLLPVKTNFFSFIDNIKCFLVAFGSSKNFTVGVSFALTSFLNSFQNGRSWRNVEKRKKLYTNSHKF